ncbi:MAG: DUF2000 family protein [bacterium]|nr:DUF2000 family protein [bacterium]
MIIVLREGLASWQLTNTIGHIAAYLGNKMSEPFDTGEYFVSKDGLNFPRNSQFAVVALKATKDELKNLETRLRNTKLSRIVYVQEMIDMIDDEELEKTLNIIQADEMDILGIGIFGPKDELKALTGTLRLWK